MNKAYFYNNLFNILFVFSFLSPTKEIFYLIGLILLVINIRFFKKVFISQLNIKLALGVIVFASFIININEVISFKDYLIAFNLLLLIFLFPYFLGSEVKISSTSIALVTLIIFLSQLTFMLDINIFKNIFYLIYDNESSDFGFDRFVNIGRNGGLFYNPNQASKYLTILLSFSLVALDKTKMKLVILFVLLLSIILTGSRTGMIIAFLILAFNIFILQKKLLLGVFSLVSGLTFLFLNQNIVEDNRSFQITRMGSFDYKLNVLSNYINNVLINGNFSDFLFGNFTAEYNRLIGEFQLSNLYAFGFDAEIGMIISFFGVVFFSLLLFFYWKQFKIILRTKYLLLTFPFLLWPLTSTILFSFKTSLVFMTILGYSVSKTLEFKEEKFSK